MSLTDTHEREILDYMFNGGAIALNPSPWYLGLSTTDPGEDGTSFTEPVGGSYARQAYSDFSAAAGDPSQVSNNVAIDFPQATGAWGALAYWMLFKGAADVEAVIYGALSPPKTILSGDRLRILSGTLIISLG